MKTQHSQKKKKRVLHNVYKVNKDQFAKKM